MRIPGGRLQAGEDPGLAELRRKRKPWRRIRWRDVDPPASPLRALLAGLIEDAHRHDAAAERRRKPAA